MPKQLNFAELKASGDLPSPKGVAMAVMQLCQQENLSLTEIAHVIRGDPALAGRIIKVANTINPNKRRPIAAVGPETLIIIGTNAIQQIVIGFSLIHQSQENLCSEFDYSRFWSRSIAMAVATQAIGAMTRIAPPTEMFTCGLLAGVGQLGLASVRPAEYAELLMQHRGVDQETMTMAETMRFGMHHCELSYHMMNDWELPRFYSEAVLFHEKPETASYAPGSRQGKLTWAIYLGSLIADACLATDDDTRNAQIAQICETGEMFELDVVEILSIADHTAKEWHEWGTLLDVHTRQLPPFRPPDRQDHLSGIHQASGELSAIRILIVDDPLTTFIVSKMLEVGGHTVFTAENAHAGLAIAETEHLHVIITDWLTPEFDAIGLCQSVRRTVANAETHFILLTMINDPQKKTEAINAGINAYLPKPFVPEQIHAELHRAQRARQLS